MDKNFKPLRKARNENIFTETNSVTQEELWDADRLRSKYFIEVDGDNIPKPISSFENMNFPVQITNYLTQKKKFKLPTPIQMQSIPCLQNKRDIISLSSTGTGKTYAYILPMVQFLIDCSVGQNLNLNQTSKICCLIVVPTRELVNQVKSVALSLLGLVFPKQNLQIPNSHFPKTYSPYFGQNTSEASNYVQHHYYHQVNLGSWNTMLSFQNFPLQTTMPNLNSQFHPPEVHSTKTNGHSENNIVVGVTGGVPISENISQITNETKVLVATPGRLIDLCERGILSLETIKYLVIDECDRLLELGFEEQLRRIITLMSLNEFSAQVSLWSATLPVSLERLARSATVKPIYISAGIENSVPSNISQTVVFTHTYQKPHLLLETLRQIPYPPVLIFTSSKHKAEEITNLLLEEQFHVSVIHSEKSQVLRNETMEGFLNSEFDILVATDLASRGLDMPEIRNVINFDMPDTIEDYIHRAGRTGRFGREGNSISFLTLDCKIANELKDLLEATNSPVPPQLNDVKSFGKKVLRTEMGDRIIE